MRLHMGTIKGHNNKIVVAAGENIKLGFNLQINVEAVPTTIQPSDITMGTKEPGGIIPPPPTSAGDKIQHKAASLKTTAKEIALNLLHEQEKLLSLSAVLPLD